MFSQTYFCLGLFVQIFYSLSKNHMLRVYLLFYFQPRFRFNKCGLLMSVPGQPNVTHCENWVPLPGWRGWWTRIRGKHQPHIYVFVSIMGSLVSFIVCKDDGMQNFNTSWYLETIAFHILLLLFRFVLMCSKSIHSISYTIRSFDMRRIGIWLIDLTSNTDEFFICSILQSCEKYLSTFT